VDVLTRKLHDQADALEKRMAGLEEAATTAEDGSEQAKQIAEEQATLAEEAAIIGDKLQARSEINAKIAKMRSGLNVCQPLGGTVTRSVAKVEDAEVAIADLPLLREMPRGTSKAAGMMLRSLATREITEIRGIGLGATEEPNSHGELSPTYDGRNSELVIADFYRTVMGILLYNSVAFQVATRVTTNTNRITIPRSDEDVEADLYLENCEIKPVTIKTTGMTINVEKIGARAQVSNELLSDAVVSVPQLVATKFGNAFAKKIDSLWLEGDTTAGIVGLLDAVTEEVDISGKNMTAVHVAEVVSKVHPYATNPVWVLSQAGIAHVMQAAASAIGRDLTQPVGITLFGMPVYRCLALPDGVLGFFGDLKQTSMIVDRSNGLTINASRDRAIEFDQTVFVGTQRLGVATHGPAYCVKLLGTPPKGV